MNLTVGLGEADNGYKVQWAVSFQWCPSGTGRSYQNYSLDDD